MAKFRALTLPKGWIEVICGPMFAGKSDELIRSLHKLQYADVEYLVFKPKADSRTSQKIASRNGLTKAAIEINDPNEIFEIIMKQNKNINIIAIDEAQFFDDSLVDVADVLADNGYVVMVAGLDRDFRGEPFGPIPKLLTKADYINKLTAICTECGAPASRTQRLINNKPAKYNDPLILVGNTESYAARCRHCHQVPYKPTNDLHKKFISYVNSLKR